MNLIANGYDIFPCTVGGGFVPVLFRHSRHCPDPRRDGGAADARGQKLRLRFEGRALTLSRSPDPKTPENNKKKVTEKLWQNKSSEAVLIAQWETAITWIKAIPAFVLRQIWIRN